MAWPLSKKEVDFEGEAYVEKLYREILPEFGNIIEDVLNVINKSMYGSNRLLIRSRQNENEFGIGHGGDSFIPIGITFLFNEKEILVSINKKRFIGKDKPLTLIRVKVKKPYTEDYVDEVKTLLITKILSSIKDQNFIFRKK